VQGYLAPRQGQSLVEFSLVLPVLLLVLFGIIEFALALHTTIDFNGAVSSGLRQATVIGADSTNDDTIGQAMFTSMRADDPNRANYFDIQLLQSRTLSDTGTDTYENFYAYNPGTHAFAIDPYLYLQTVLASRGSIPSPCQYFYEAHEVRDVNDSTRTTVYLDQSQQIVFSNPPPVGDPFGLSTHLASVLSDSSLLNGCGRIYDIDYGAGSPPDGKSAYDTTNWTCARAGAPAPGVTGNLCYYYPNERINEINPLLPDNTSLTDEVEVDLSYTYKPLGDYVTTHTPLGFGFSITEHARGRIEPTAATT
jgi:hypothetical protein